MWKISEKYFLLHLDQNLGKNPIHNIHFGEKSDIGVFYFIGLTFLHKAFLRKRRRFL